MTLIHDIENSIISLLVRFFIALFAAVGNIIIVLTIIRSSRLCTRAYNILIAQLAVADFIVGLGLMVRVVSMAVLRLSPPENYTELYCVSIAAITIFGCQLSQLTVLLIALDRLSAIRCPMDYKNKDPFWYPLRRFLVCIVLSCAGLGTLYMTIDPHNTLEVCTLSGGDIKSYAPYWIAFSILLYFLIFVSYGWTIYLLNDTREVQKKLESTREFARQKKVFLLISVVLASYFICYVCPFISMLLGLIFNAPDMILSILALINGFSFGINAAINILLYGWKYKELRAAMIDFVKCEGPFRELSIRTDGCFSLQPSTRRKYTASSERTTVPVTLEVADGDVLL